MGFGHDVVCMANTSFSCVGDHRADYAAGGLKMLAVTNPTSNAIWAQTTAAAMIPIRTLFSYAGVTSAVFLVEAALLGWWMYRGAILTAVRMGTAPTSSAAARPLFTASIVHLLVSMSLLVAHRIPYGLNAQVTQAPPQTSELHIQHPWELMAPFPFLPLPIGVPAKVLENNKR